MKRALRDNDYSGVNARALTAVNQAVIQLKGIDSYVSEKADKIRHLADTFYSAKKWLKYPGGPDRLHADMLHDLCGRISQQLDHLDRLRKSQEL